MQFFLGNFHFLRELLGKERIYQALKLYKRMGSGAVLALEKIPFFAEIGEFYECANKIFIKYETGK